MSGVLLDGWYGKQNTGDDAFCLVGALRYSRHLAPRGVAVLADVHGVPDLPAGVRVVAYRSNVRGLQRAYSLTAAARMGAVVHLGGSRFDRRTTRVMRDQARLARKGIAHLHAQAVSIGPFDDPSHASTQAELLSQFTSISVRDTASLRRARDIGLQRVVQAFDVAVLLPGLTGVAERPVGALVHRRADGYPDGPVIGVALRDPDAHDREDPRVAAQRETQVTATLQSLSGRYPRLRVVFLCFGAADTGVSQRIVARLASACDTQVARYSRRPADTLRAIAACDFVIAMRLHAAIFSYALCVPFAVIDYHAKCREFCQEVGADPQLVYPVTGPSSDQRERLVAIMDDPERLHRLPELPLTAARDLAETSFREVHAHLPSSANHPRAS